MWCAGVLDWDALVEHPQSRQLEVVQTVVGGSGATNDTTVCPIRIDGQKLTSPTGSCAIGEHNDVIDAEFDLL